MATSGRVASGTGTARGSYAKTEQRRDVILDAALEVFAQSGYRRGSIREIAERVGMSEPGLLHHFPNKGALLAAVLERRDLQSLAVLNLDSGDGPVTITGLIALARYNASVPGVVELYCTLSAEATSPDHPAHQYFIDRYARHRDNITKAFKDLGSRGLLRPERRSQQCGANNAGHDGRVAGAVAPGRIVPRHGRRASTVSSAPGPAAAGGEAPIERPPYSSLAVAGAPTRPCPPGSASTANIPRCRLNSRTGRSASQPTSATFWPARVVLGSVPRNRDQVTACGGWA